MSRSCVAATEAVVVSGTIENFSSNQKTRITRENVAERFSNVLDLLQNRMVLVKNTAGKDITAELCARLIAAAANLVPELRSIGRCRYTYTRGKEGSNADLRLVEKELAGEVTGSLLTDYTSTR